MHATRLLHGGLASFSRPLGHQYLPLKARAFFSTNFKCLAANIFDRKVKKHQRELAGSQPDSSVYDYVKEEVSCMLRLWYSWWASKTGFNCCPLLF